MNTFPQVNLINYQKHKKGEGDFSVLEDTGLHELSFCLSGKLKYILNGRTFTIDANDAIYVSPQDSCKKQVNEETGDFVCFYFRVNSEKLFSETFIKNIISKKVLAILDMIDSDYKANSIEKAEVLLNYLAKEISSSKQEVAEKSIIVRMKDYISKNLHNKITVADVANCVYLSKIYCENVFKKETGLTIVTYINNEKIRLAKELLQKPEVELSSIPGKIGITDYNYFARLFKKVTGISPLRFRKTKINNLSVNRTY